MPDQIIDPAMARSVHADAMRVHPLFGGVVLRDPPEYPDKVFARLVAATPTPYVGSPHGAPGEAGAIQRVQVPSG